VRGDLCSHRARAKDCDIPNHSLFLIVEYREGVGHATNCSGAL